MLRAPPRPGVLSGPGVLLAAHPHPMPTMLPLPLHVQRPHYMFWGIPTIAVSTSHDLLNWTMVDPAWVVPDGGAATEMWVEAGSPPEQLSDGNYIMSYNIADGDLWWGIGTPPISLVAKDRKGDGSLILIVLFCFSFLFPTSSHPFPFFFSPPSFVSIYLEDWR